MIWNIDYADLPKNLHGCCEWVDYITGEVCLPTGSANNPSTGNKCGFIGNGLCLIDDSDFSCSGEYENSAIIVQSIDICDLIANASEHLIKKSLNIFHSPCQ